MATTLWMLLARKRVAGYYDHWQVIAHSPDKEAIERREQEYAARSKKKTTAIIETIGASYTTVPGNGAEPTFTWEIVGAPPATEEGAG